MSEAPGAVGGDWVREVFPTAELARGARLAPVGSRRRELAKRGAGRALDAALGARAALVREGGRLDAAAARVPARDVLVLGIYRPEGAADMARALAPLASSRHRVEVVLGATGAAAPELARETAASGLEGGKFANLNRLLEGREGVAPDWALLLDDDVRLPARFIDRLLGVAEDLGLDLCQPAQTWGSDAAWRITRRRPALARRTRFVEIGPVTLLRGGVLAAVTPFSEEGMGWGQCLHWAALARERDWSLGIVDSLAVAHDLRPTASAYDEHEALEAARRYLAAHAHIRFAEAQETLEVVR